MKSQLGDKWHASWLVSLFLRRPMLPTGDYFGNVIFSASISLISARRASVGFIMFIIVSNNADEMAMASLRDT